MLGKTDGAFVLDDLVFLDKPGNDQGKELGVLVVESPEFGLQLLAGHAFL